VHEDEVAWTGPEHLVPDLEAVAFGVSNVSCHALATPYRCEHEVLGGPDNRRAGSVTAPSADRIPPAAVTLFLSLFAAQAAVIAITPVLADVARDFNVSTATAGQLRSVSGLTAGIAALTIGTLSTRFGLRDLLLIGLTVLGAGSLASAVAPAFAVLAAAQVAVGAGLAVVLSAALAAAAAWSSEGQRAKLLSWTLIGQPAAWIVGMPVVGLVGDVSWRLAWLAVPFAASLVALVAVRARCPDVATESGKGTWQLLRRSSPVAGWALGELLAFSAWAGTLVFAGALLVESYGSSPAAAGLLLGLAAVAYLPGNFLARRLIGKRSRMLLVVLPLAAGAIVAVFGAYRPAPWASAAILCVLAFVSGARTIVGSALGLDLCARRQVFAMRIRAAATQFGYLFGAVLGGLALATGGYAALGATFAVLFGLAAIPHGVVLLAERRPSRPAASRGREHAADPDFGPERAAHGSVQKARRPLS
jgi:DHA1 family inner membrane transport protein